MKPLRDWARRHRVLLFIVVLVGLVGLLGIEENLRGRWALQRYLRDLSSRGVPIQIEAVRALSVAPELNAFPEVYHAASRLLGSRLARFPPPLFTVVETARVSVVFRETNWTASLNSQETTNLNWALMEADLTEFADAFRALESAVVKTGWDPGTDHHPVSGMRSGDVNLRALRALAVALSAAAVTDCQSDRLEAGAVKLAKLLAVIRLMETDPSMGSQSVRGTMTRWAFQATWQALQRPGWTAAQLRTLQEAWQDLRFAGPMAGALGKERILSIRDYDRAAESDHQAKEIFGDWRGWETPGSVAVNSLEDALAVVYERRTELAMRGAWIPLWRWVGVRHDELEFLRSLEGIQTDLIAVPSGATPAPRLVLTEWEASGGSSGFHRLLSGRRLRQLQNAAGRTLSWEVLKDLTVAALALRRYELRHGEMPASLEALRPEFLSQETKDVFCGGSLSFQRLGPRRARLYSVGRNQVDDGGDASPRWPELGRNDLLDGLDIVWPEPAEGNRGGALER